ncbi:deuterosome assembly protein 1 isoform X2 [Engystomops pustulosus]|uniref:deuterosome assembly protein 1 isoform X2 n=1 Tax=Engystomops pustulosus TaxID=76066 RepID=UPI003AFAEA24
MTEQLAAPHKYQTMGDSSCENELEDLMHQIDIMVNSKKVEWEKQVLVLEQRLEAQEQELNRTRGAVEQKNCEIEVLSRKLEEAEKTQSDVVQNYETQLEALKSQLCKLKKSYDKLHYYHMKNHKRESIDSSPDHDKSQSELRWLSQKLEEYKDQAKEWESQRLLYQNNIKKLNEQRKNLLEKCQYLQSQSREEPLAGRTPLQDQAITNNQSEIRRLRRQLDTSQETIRSGGVIIENLKSTVKEITLSRNSLKDENQRLLQQLRDCQERCQSMEDRLSEATIALQAREDLSRAAELDQRQLQKLILWKTQENNISSQESDMLTKERTPNREIHQKRLKLSPTKQDQAEKDYSIKKESRNLIFQRLQADVSDLTEKLHQKDITIATISQKVSRLERELDMKEDGKVLRQQILELSAESYPLHDLTWGRERCIKPCSDSYDLEALQLEMMDPLSWQKVTTGKLSQEKQYREEGETTLKTADDDKNLPCYQSCDQECPTHNDRPIPEMDLADFSLFVCDDSGDNPAAPGTDESFVSAAERFLQEETRRAQDFENILNSHIEELQRYSEHTVKRYTVGERTAGIVS